MSKSSRPTIYRTKDTDYSAQVTKAKSLGAEGIALGACYQNAAAIAKEMQKQGLNVPITAAPAPARRDTSKSPARRRKAHICRLAALASTTPRPEVQAYVKKIKAQAQRRTAAL